MEYFLGKRSAMAYAVESTWGVPNPATNWACPGKVQKFSDEDSQNYEPLNSMCSGIDTRTVDEYYPMTPTFGATIETYIQHLRFLSLGIGPDNYDGVGGIHNISIGNDLRSFGMQIKLAHTSTPFTVEYSGCMINRVELIANKNDFLRGSVNVSAKTATKIPDIKPYNTTVDSLKRIATSDTRPYRSSDMETVIDSDDISKAVQQARITIENDLLIDEGLDSSNGNYITEQAPQIAKISASLTVKMDKSDLWDLFRDGNVVDNCHFKWIRGADYISIPFSGTKISKAGKPIDVTQGVVIQEITMDIPSITIEEKNGITTEYSVNCS